MTYRQDSKRRAAAKWHALLNNGMHYVVQDSTGRIHATGATPNAPAIKQARRFRPDLMLVRVDDQL